MVSNFYLPFGFDILTKMTMKNINFAMWLRVVRQKFTDILPQSLVKKGKSSKQWREGEAIPETSEYTM
jgi:hypothetical protein